MLTPGDLIDRRYVIGDLLGRGGMAEVHRATDVVDGRAYALKVMRDTEPGLEDRFRREAEALARIDHPGLIRLHRAGAHRGVGYLVLDLAEGPPLNRALAGGPAGVQRTVSMGRQVAAALAHVHGLGLVHRDVKPSNILLHHGRALLTDFGIARLPGAPSLTVTGQVIGSAPYLAPEQVEGHPAGPPADVYALGLVLIECLTGRRCFPGTYTESAISRLHRGPEIPPGPAWLRHVLVAMTDRDPARRPPAEAVAEALARRDVAPVIEATAPLVAAPAGRRLGHGRRAGARALAAAAAVLVTLGWTVLGGDPPPQHATPDEAPPPTTAVALVSDPAPSTGDAAAAAAGPTSHEGRADRSTGRGSAPSAGPVEPPASDPSAGAARPAALDAGPPAATPDDAPDDAPTTSSVPTTTTTASSTAPPAAGNGNGNGSDDGSSSGNGSGSEGGTTGSDGADPGASAPPDIDS